MRNQKRISSVAALAAATALLAVGGLGCAGRTVDVMSTGDDSGAESVDSRAGEFGGGGSRATPSDRGEVSVSDMERAVQDQLRDVFFAFDKYDLTADSRTRLNQDAAVLRASPSIDVVIEGHCDERGTNEYNLALGERRARAAKNYLVQAGVSADRLFVISYGEERPFAMGHDESAWSQNRRAHFRVRAR